MQIENRSLINWKGLNWNQRKMQKDAMEGVEQMLPSREMNIIEDPNG